MPRVIRGMSSRSHLAACFAFWFIFPLGSKGQQWPTYGGDAGGTRYSSASQINVKNVSRLKPVWTHHTGALQQATGPNSVAAFEATPVLFKRTLYLSTPFDKIIALDAATGKRRWIYDPKLEPTRYHAWVTSRGVALWHEPSGQFRGPCSDRVFIGTLEARLIAVDAATGQPCKDFGMSRGVDLTEGVEFDAHIEYKVTSAPTVVGDVVVVGSFVQDNLDVQEPLGIVRGFDVRTGKLRWTWDPIPWAHNGAPRTGAGNAWSTISADLERGLIFIPTGSASPDYFGGLRPGDNKFANSVVALEAATGKFIWGFQIVHHDLWDYDVAAQPLLFTFKGIPAIAIAGKTGFVFVLNRLTGEPLYPVEERPVPRSQISGEHAAATQPFSSLPPLVPLRSSSPEPWGASPEDLEFCREALKSLSWKGIFTPPTTDGLLLFPSNYGGVNWGSTAFDPKAGVLYANTNNVPALIKLIPRDEVVNYWQLATNRIKQLFGRPTSPTYSERFQQVSGLHNRFTGEFSPQRQTPYFVYRDPLIAPSGLPCTKPPWGKLTALNLNSGQKAWDVPLGTMIPGMNTGSINLGGPIVTAGGLVFTAASTDPYLRAFDSASGRELSKWLLPAPAQATPMTYVIDGKQYVVICAGGDGQLGTTLSDAVIAFSL